MKQYLLTAFLLFITGLSCLSQNLEQNSCGQKAITERLLQAHPELKKRNDNIESLLANYTREKTAGLQKNFRTTGTITLPVVVHIIHNNGSENISDANIMQGIQHLNEAFSHSGNYTSDKGVNTQIQFCLAQRDPQGKSTNGITRNVSAYTNMGGNEYYSDDLNVKNINRWSPECYINIWLVNSIPGNVVGYAYLPSAAGTNVDGIVMEAAYFGSSAKNDVVITHEMGHYLGLYHTFENGCVNNDCITDGDKVCDTPPDQSTAGIGCNVNMNSCVTDILSGFNTDQNDLKEDFLDYGNFDCMKVFTAGQADRMNWFVNNVRFGLMNCRSCMPPCPAPVTAAFISSSKTVSVGATVNFKNQSVNAERYDWYIDGGLKSSVTDYAYLFTDAGIHIVKLVAKNSNILCNEDAYIDTILVTCPVIAAFTDPAGIITAGQTTNFTNTSTSASAYTWKINDIIISNTADLSFLFSSPGIYTVTLIAAGNLCSDSKSNIISVYDSSGAIPPELCMQTTFQKKYVDNNTFLWDLQTTKDSGFIMGGSYSIPYVDVYGGAFAAKLNRGGTLEWAKYIMPVSSIRIQKLRETKDRNFIGIGYMFPSSYNQDPNIKTVLLKLNSKGDVVWAKKFGIANSHGETGRDVIETKDGGFAFCGANEDDGWKYTNWMVAKTDGNGNIIWSKKFDYGFYERAYGIVANEDTLVVTGIRIIPGLLRSEIVVTKLRASDGSIIQAKTYAVANRSVETSSIFKVPGGYMVGAHSIADGFYYADMDIVVLRLDENLNVVKAAKIEADIFASVHAGFAPTPDGGFVAFQDGGNWSITKDVTKVYMYKVSSQWQLEWAKQFPIALAEGQSDFCVNGISITPDNGYVAAETYLDNTAMPYTSHARIIKTDNHGNTPGCLTDTFRANLIIPNVTATNFMWAEGKIIFNEPSNPSIHNSVVKDAQLTEIQRCETSLCNYLKIKGYDSVCNITDTLTYVVKRNSQCASSVQWQVDSNMAKIIGVTDSSVRIKFKNAGQVKLTAKIVTACLVLKDSINIFIANSHSDIDLGPDISLCKQSTVRLNAGGGFRSYKWNDASADSTLTAFFPGAYHVTAIDYCGNYYSDTITISQAPDVSLDLGPDLNLCDNDSITISVHEAFEKYTWAPAYNINTTSGKTIKVWPAVDTVYILTAQLNSACIAIDSVHIKVLKSAPLYLGNDTSFCLGGYKILKGPPGFVSYLWQDGSVTPELIAAAKGTYWLHTFNYNGCISKDTLQVTDVYPLPVLNLGKDGKICSNTNIIFNAGAGSVSYLWQDGSTQPVLSANAPGKYWVTITNNNNCSNSDTINITGLNPQPQNFLDPSIEICENEVIQIKPNGTWQSYLWSDNTAQSSLAVSSAGQFWLEVSNSFGCKGRDTINVSLQYNCPKTIYFPNAFTPNNDGRNDIFKANAFAPIEKFNLVIYNRWGEKIFETNNISKGWNGDYKGTSQGPSAFIWYCAYKFYGESEKHEKGTIVLIR